MGRATPAPRAVPFSSARPSRQPSILDLDDLDIQMVSTARPVRGARAIAWFGVAVTWLITTTLGFLVATSVPAHAHVRPAVLPVVEAAPSAAPLPAAASPVETHAPAAASAPVSANVSPAQPAPAQPPLGQPATSGQPTTPQLPQPATPAVISAEDLPLAAPPGSRAAHATTPPPKVKPQPTSQAADPLRGVRPTSHRAAKATTDDDTPAPAPAPAPVKAASTPAPAPAPAKDPPGPVSLDEMIRRAVAAEQKKKH
jgi:hypothetical protein